MSDLKTQAVRSVVVTLGAQVIKFVLGLGITMVLARLLTPKDYGIVAMVGVITGLMAVFRDGGLSVVTVQRADISDAQVSTLFWINTALGLGTALVVTLLSPVVAWFYNDEALLWVVVALALPFIFAGLTAQPQALLQRQMQFKEIAFIEITSLIVSAGIGVITAAAGWGYWALVAMTIVTALVNTALVFFFCRWRPNRPARSDGMRSMIKFGGELTANKLFDSLACSTDSLLLGKFFTPDMVGQYTRAQSLMLLPLSQIMPALLSVSLPVMSRLAERPEHLRRIFLDLLQLTSFTSSFITIFLVVGADSLIRIFLGSQWIETADVLRLMAGPAFFIPLSTLSVASLTALGNGATLVRWSLLKNIFTIIAIVIGVSWGANGVAGALTIISILILLPLLNKITANTGVATLKQIWLAIGPGIFACITGLALLNFMQSVLSIEYPLIRLLLLAVANIILHVLLIAVLPDCRRTFLRVLKIVISARVI